VHSLLALEIIEELVISQKFLTALSALSIHFFWCIFCNSAPRDFFIFSVLKESSAHPVALFPHRFDSQ